MYEPDSYEEMMAAAYAGNGCLSCGASTHTQDHCPVDKAYEDEMRIWRERRLAAVARRGGNVFRDHFNRLGDALDDGNVQYWAEGLADGHYTERNGIMQDRSGRVLLPEAAFDWPIYRAALRLEHLGHIGLEHDGDLY